MVPREHGAYGQLLLPIVTALALGRPTVAALLISGAAALAFIAHEPALVALGRRGARARRERWPHAIGLLLLLTGLAVAIGAAAVLKMPAADRWLLVVPVACGALAALVLVAGSERSTAGEIVISTALASVSLPVAIAAGASMAAALTCAATFAAAFAAATVSVRAVIAGARGSSRGERRLALAIDAALLMLVAMLAFGRVILPAAVWAAAPVGAVALGLAAVIPPPRYLRQIGWTLVAATALTGGILVIAAR